jgi:hypothetical protein
VVGVLGPGAFSSAQQLQGCWYLQFADACGRFAALQKALGLRCYNRVFCIRGERSAEVLLRRLIEVKLKMRKRVLASQDRLAVCR